MTSDGRDEPQVSVIELEERWLAKWEQDQLYECDVRRLSNDDKFYNLVEFPYPSAEGLHVGHVYTYAGADTYGRFIRMQGQTVYQPIGFDSFGIHTENFALRAGIHPKQLTEKTIQRYRKQLKRLGAAWSWHTEIITSDPSYYKWTQWIFLQFYKAGLARRKTAPVVWCPSCLTVLAHEQLDGTRCERCSSQVTEKTMKQWFLSTTEYADALLGGLDQLDWPSSAKTLQRNWIGRSEGFDIRFLVDGSNTHLTVFTTRPETIFGVTFIACASGHPITSDSSEESRERLTWGETSVINDDDVPSSHLDESEAESDLRGVFTGKYAINPINGTRIPVFVANYVLGTYGTGAAMGVPAHDLKDYKFAKANDLPIAWVISTDGVEEQEPWTGEGILKDSAQFSGMDTTTARVAISQLLTSLGVAESVTRFRLHDWLISRQRYWGPPIPIIYCTSCGIVPVPEIDLPVLLPEVQDVVPRGTGESPLASVPSFVNVNCPNCNRLARRETDVSDTFLDSAWYFLRYPSSQRNEVPWDPEITKQLLPVDFYAGGREHIVRHHLYARFVCHVLKDLGHITFSEPFPSLRLHGHITKDGAKMSKSRGNVVDPDDYIARFGADNLRMYLLFCGPWQEGADFRDQGLSGIVRFTSRVSKLITDEHNPGKGGVDLSVVSRTIRDIERDLLLLKFNTAIATLMKFTRWIGINKPMMSTMEWETVSRTLLLLYAPFAPISAEELWSRIGGTYSIHTQPWPYLEDTARGDTGSNIAVAIDGKVRDHCIVMPSATEEDARRAALSRVKISAALEDKAVTRVVYVPGRLINFVLEKPSRPDP